MIYFRYLLTIIVLCYVISTSVLAETWESAASTNSAYPIYTTTGSSPAPTGSSGIYTKNEPDFGPYMRDLQKRIKMNWDPPKGSKSKRVVLIFKIAKDGKLLSCSVFKSSGLPGADKAAINAVQATAPFGPLPPEFKGSSIDIRLTFDYNGFGASGYH
jgi:TonB family protein